MSDEHPPETPADPEAAQPTQVMPAVSDIDAALEALSETAGQPNLAEPAGVATQPAETAPAHPVAPPADAPQSPLPQAVTVPAGSRVIAIVSRGPSPARPAVPVGMPGVLGEEQGAALLKLQDVGLSAQVLGDHSERLPRGYVMGQYPVPGASVQPGTDAVLLVSRGRFKLPAQSVVLPRLVGMSQTMAIDTLQATSLVPRIHYDFDPVAVPGTVLAQLPSEEAHAERVVRKRSSRVWIVSVIVLVAIAAAAAGVWFFNRPTTIPNLIGMSQSAAEQTLVVAGFRLGSVSTSQTLSAADIGNVIAQAPAPGDTAPHGSSLDLIISGGQVLIQVPNVTGVTESQARKNLQAVGLLFSASEGYSSTVPSGSIISQAPAAGQRVPSGTTVGVTISMGTRTVTVPGVAGQTQDTAQTSLKTAGFGTQVASNYDTSTANGTVIGQLPTAGTPSLPGTIVGLTVSKGQAPLGSSVATVPVLAGKTETKAKSALSSAGLKALVVSWAGTTQRKGRVASQLPDSNIALTKGSTVIIFVSNGK